jgi:putative two-component system response regulator
MSNCDYPEARILVIDDNTDSLSLVKQLLELIGYLNVTTLDQPSIALDVITANPPDLILLDLQMPGVSGYDILKRLPEVFPPSDFRPVLVFTGDDSAEAKVRALNLGASDFITKPFDPPELVLRIRNFLRMRRMHVQLSDGRDALESAVQDRTKDLGQSRFETLECLARAAEYRDDATGEHTRRVGVMSGRMAEALGLDSEAVELMRLAAPLHDLGKIAIPDAILLKPAKLSDSEFEVIMKHPEFGAMIIGDCSSPLMEKAKEIALHHHERWDGSGYPDHLSGTQIPLSCRIVAVADMYDALTHVRPYKPAWTHDQAIAEISSVSGRQFDSAVVDKFLALR